MFHGSCKEALLTAFFTVVLVMLISCERPKPVPVMLIIDQEFEGKVWIMNNPNGQRANYSDGTLVYRISTIRENRYDLSQWPASCRLKAKFENGEPIETILKIPEARYFISNLGNDDRGNLDFKLSRKAESVVH